MAKKADMTAFTVEVESTAWTTLKRLGKKLEAPLSGRAMVRLAIDRFIEAEEKAK